MPKTTKEAEPSVSHSDLAKALVQAIEAAKPLAKKTILTRTKNTPWTPKDGSPRLKLKRKAYQHGIAISTERVTNEVIDLLNKLRPGSYCDGYVKVIRRRDKGIDIDYPIKTASQRLRLVNQYGIRDFSELLKTCIAEAEKPKQDTEAELD